MENYIQATVVTIIGALFIIGSKTFTYLIINTQKDRLKATGKNREIHQYEITLTKASILILGIGFFSVGILGFFYDYN